VCATRPSHLIFLHFHRHSIISCRTQIVELLDAQISLPPCLVPLSSQHTEHTLVKILQREMQIYRQKHWPPTAVKTVYCNL